MGPGGSGIASVLSLRGCTRRTRVFLLPGCVRAPGARLRDGIGPQLLPNRGTSLLQPGLSSLPQLPLKEKLRDERQRSWQRPSMCSWEIMLGMRKTCKGNTQKSQPSNRVRTAVLCYSSSEQRFPPHTHTLWLPKKWKRPFRYKPGAATTVLSHVWSLSHSRVIAKSHKTWYGLTQSRKSILLLHGIPAHL